MDKVDAGKIVSDQAPREDQTAAVRGGYAFMESMREYGQETSHNQNAGYLAWNRKGKRQIHPEVAKAFFCLGIDQSTCDQKRKESDAKAKKEGHSGEFE